MFESHPTLPGGRGDTVGGRGDAVGGRGDAVGGRGDALGGCGDAVAEGCDDDVDLTHVEDMGLGEGARTPPCLDVASETMSTPPWISIG